MSLKNKFDEAFSLPKSFTPKDRVPTPSTSDMDELKVAIKNFTGEVGTFADMVSAYNKSIGKLDDIVISADKASKVGAKLHVKLKKFKSVYSVGQKDFDQIASLMSDLFSFFEDAEKKFREKKKHIESRDRNRSSTTLMLARKSANTILKKFRILLKVVMSSEF